MRIAYVVPRCVTGNSHGRYVLELVHRIGLEHEVHVFSGAFPPEDRIPAVLRRVPMPDRPAIARLGTWWAISRFLVAGERFDVVHTQGGDAPVGTVVTAPCCNKAIRLALQATGDGRQEYARRRPVWLTRLNARIAEIADRSCLLRAGTRRIIIPSRHVGEELRTLYHVKPEKMMLVPHGVNLETFSPAIAGARRAAARASFGLRAGDLVGIYVGGAYRLKGLLPLVEALRQIPDRKLRLLAMGVSANGELAQRARGLEDRVIFAGPVEDMMGAYAAADFFVLPTLYDGFSLATLEAMACGLPVVVSRRAGVSDLLTDGGEGILLEHADDPVEIAHALARLRTDAPWREQSGARARATAVRYSCEEMARRTLIAYAESNEGSP